MSKEISMSYEIDLDVIKNVLESIINEEESHQRILNELTEFLAKNKEKKEKVSILNFPTTLKR
jgi:rubrerythrin